MPNGKVLESRFGQSQSDIKVEHRHRLGTRDGAMRVTLVRNRGRFGRFDDALTAAAEGMPIPPTCGSGERG